jgi:hypothetical protein
MGRHDELEPSHVLASGPRLAHAMVEFVTGAVRGTPCVVEATGNTAGFRTRCKKGDLVAINLTRYHKPSFHS